MTTLDAFLAFSSNQSVTLGLCAGFVLTIAAVRLVAELIGSKP